MTSSESCIEQQLRCCIDHGLLRLEVRRHDLLFLMTHIAVACIVGGQHNDPSYREVRIAIAQVDNNIIVRYSIMILSQVVFIVRFSITIPVYR